MRPRSPRPRWLRFVLIATLACGPARPRGFSAERLSAPLLRPPLPKPDRVLRTPEGVVFDFKRNTEGFLTLLFFGYTSCPDLCPAQMAKISTAMHRMDPGLARRLKVVFVTVDPKRDTPVRIRDWLDLFDQGFIGLTGDSGSIALAFTQLRLGHPVAQVAERADSSASITNHTVVGLAFTTDNLAHVAYPSGIGAVAWAKDLAILARGT